MPRRKQNEWGLVLSDKWEHHLKATAKSGRWKAQSKSLAEYRKSAGKKRNSNFLCTKGAKNG